MPRYSSNLLCGESCVFSQEKETMHINKSNIALVWFLDNRYERNCSVVIYHMMGRKKKNTLLPYSRLVTKILEHNRFDLEEDE